MEQLDDLMDKLNSDKFCAVTVYDRDTSKPIFRNVTHEQIKNDYGTAEEFFEKVFAEGYKKLTLQEKRKNGANAFKMLGDPFDVSFGNTTQADTKQTFKKKKKKRMKSGLMGLGMTEIFDLKMQAYDRGELARKLAESQRENKELKAKNEELNEEKLQRRYTKESNDSFNNMVLGAIKQTPIILKGLGFNIPIEVNGLGVASADDVENDTYSEVKKSFLETIKSLDDDTIALLQVIYQKINEKSENNVFSQELFELLQQHKMLV